MLAILFGLWHPSSPPRGLLQERNTVYLYSMPDYAELCCLSNFSFLTGASHPQELVARAAGTRLPGHRPGTDECSLAGVVRASRRSATQRCAERGQHDPNCMPGFSWFRLEDRSRLILLPLERGRLCTQLCTLITRGRRNVRPRVSTALPEPTASSTAWSDCLAHVAAHRVQRRRQPSRGQPAYGALDRQPFSRSAPGSAVNLSPRALTTPSSSSASACLRPEGRGPAPGGVWRRAHAPSGHDACCTTCSPAMHVMAVRCAELGFRSPALGRTLTCCSTASLLARRLFPAELLAARPSCIAEPLSSSAWISSELSLSPGSGAGGQDRQRASARIDRRPASAGTLARGQPIDAAPLRAQIDS